MLEEACHSSHELLPAGKGRFFNRKVLFRI